MRDLYQTFLREQPITAGAADVMTRADQILHFVYRHLQYVSGSTGSLTDAETAAAISQGVCQDYAQIMLALCRIERIPARYVAGMLVGEGESHAWVEVYDGYGWQGLDPTNEVERCGIANGYIRLAHGRDSLDASLSRGVFHGFTEQQQSVHVLVQEADRNERTKT